MIYWLQFFWTGLLRLLVSCTKNAIKVLIGRRTYFDPRIVFFFLYVKQLVVRQPIRYVTCDGFLSLIDPIDAETFAASDASADGLESLVVASQTGESAAV